MSNIKVGQIWREVDNRFTRFVRIVEAGSLVAGHERVLVRTVVPENSAWKDKPRCLTGNASASRFNGHYGGYALHEDVSE